MKKHFTTIAFLDTLGLVATAFVGGWFFSLVFHAPMLIGFLYGAIISATDLTILIPLFRQYKVGENLRTVLVTESIFNDPLGIVLTSVAVALTVPQATSARMIEYLASLTNMPVAAITYFMYQLVMSVAIGAGFEYLAHWLIVKMELYKSPEETVIFSLSVALAGFLVGEEIRASGYLIATTTGIILGNHHIFFKEGNLWGRIRATVDTE
ncbi:MAG: cation:proton antiporter [Desulfurococcales archaeon]|nr:cation:proton antiporter [Desulfurococcales archaeon]